jgi:hypothetical protein
MVVAGSSLPDSFKGQLGASLMARGSKGVEGYLLSVGGRPKTLLKSTLEKLRSLG